MNLTYIANLAKVKVDLHAKDEGRMSNGSAVRAQRNGQTDRWMVTTNCIISLLRGAMWSIKKEFHYSIDEQTELS